MLSVMHTDGALSNSALTWCSHNRTNDVYVRIPKKNKGIGSLCFEAFTAENKRRAGGVTFIRVKGHSGDIGNDNADDRVQWGKANGPYCRFRRDRSHEGDYLDSPHPCDSQPCSSSTSHPSPTKRFRTPSKRFPFESNLSSIRKRIDDASISSRPNVSGFNALVANSISNQALKALSCPWLLYYHRNARQG